MFPDFVIPFRFSFEWKKTKPEMGEGGGILSGKRGWHRFCYPSYLYFFSLAFLSDFSKFQFYSYYHLYCSSTYLFSLPITSKKICQIAANMPSVTPTPGHCANIQNIHCEESLAVAVSCWECEMQTSLTSSRRIIFFKSVGIFFVKWQQSCCGFKFVSKV